MLFNLPDTPWCFFLWGRLHSRVIHVPWTYLSQHSKLHLDRFSRFCTAHGGEALYFTVCINTRLHNNTRLTALCPRLPSWAGTRKVKPIWILLKQETVGGSGISWTICKSAPRPRQIASTPPLSFLQAGCPSCHPTNSVKRLTCN